MIQEAALELLFQIEGVVDQCEEEDYTKPLDELGGATLGQHVRHTLEFFICLQKGVEEKCINYDKREHNTLLESSRKLTAQVIDGLRSFLEGDLSDFPLILEANYSLQPGSECRIHTSFFRELAYTVEHAIHHMALMAVAIRVSFSYIRLPEGFGVASSTLRYRQQVAEN